MIGYVKCFDSNKTMSFKFSDKRPLKEYTKIWGRGSSLIDKKLDSYGDTDKYIKTKIKSCGDKINTYFQGKKVPKENSYKCLSFKMLDSVIKVNKKHYPQTLLEECKYETKNNKMENNINDDFDSSSPDESENEPDSEPDSDESDSESNNEYKNSFKKSDNKSKNPFEKSDNKSKNPYEKSDNEFKNPFEKSDSN